ncbi:MAG: hypothetical protein LBR40_03470 [Bacilli bacterium]|jgi:hypothetical protein|nr:hypothetical protein [Bacilli bacterium]
MATIIIGIIIIGIIFILAMIISIRDKDEKLNQDELQEELNNQFKLKKDDDVEADLCIAYKLEKSTKYQNNIINVITFDNRTSIASQTFKGLSDDEINHKYSAGQQIWQYDDPFGIKDFDVADKISEDGLEIKAQLDDEYVTIGYINHEDGKFILENRNNIVYKRLLYRGGYYKQSINNKVNTDFENYILKLAICYNK